MYNVVRDALTKLKYMTSIKKVWQQSGLGVINEIKLTFNCG